jgi:hypothetical protein
MARGTGRKSNQSLILYACAAECGGRTQTEGELCADCQMVIAGQHFITRNTGSDSCAAPIYPSNEDVAR